MYGPRCLCDKSQLYSLLELLRYRAAARSRKGVVGNTGKKIPRTPSISETVPKKANIYFIRDMQHKRFMQSY